MRILLIEDDNSLREQICDRLKSEGFAIDSAADGEEGLYLAREMPVDIAIIDLGLPIIDGMEIIQTIRDEGHLYPILILTARDRWQDRVEGLEAGADDYLGKPFHLEELMARIRALLRRVGGWAHPLLDFGELRIETREQKVTIAGTDITLTAYEYKVLEYLAIHAGEVISKPALLDHLYDEDTERDTNVLEVFVRRLRRKLDPESTLNPIETLRGRGYRFALERANTAET
ncbi:DNA-binding response regulator [Chromatiales bacterium (ex Bugula neritina AB1)]|nr:DNA-binding response regulator [Chromatiales bacterium (ex Bugula neritina AB1)]